MTRKVSWLRGRCSNVAGQSLPLGGNTISPAMHRGVLADLTMPARCSDVEIARCVVPAGGLEVVNRG